MSVFTDDDLRVLKANLYSEKVLRNQAGTVNWNFLKRLVARLEAAEKAMLAHLYLEPGFQEYLEAWRKAAGK